MSVLPVCQGGFLRNSLHLYSLASSIQGDSIYSASSDTIVFPFASQRKLLTAQVHLYFLEKRMYQEDKARGIKLGTTIILATLFLEHGVKQDV